MGRNARTTNSAISSKLFICPYCSRTGASRTLSAAPTVAARTHHNETFKTCSPWPSAPGPSCKPWRPWTRPLLLTRLGRSGEELGLPCTSRTCQARSTWRTRNFTNIGLLRLLKLGLTSRQHTESGSYVASRRLTSLSGETYITALT